MQDFHYWLAGYGPKMWISLFATLLVLAAGYSLYTRRRKRGRDRGVPVTHDDLWKGIDLKIKAAQTTLEQMRKVLRPPAPTSASVVQESAGTIVGGPDWQSTFWPLVNRFLAEVRSVPSIIEACFGKDLGSREMKVWWNWRDPDEQRRREAFSAKFKHERKKIDRHALTPQRNVSEHRLGIVEMEANVVGPFGAIHTATPTKRILDAECRPLEPNVANNPGAQWAATQPSQPIRPKPEQFTITRAKKPLFPECEAYLALAEQLVARARALSGSVHGADHLTSPPSD